MIYLASASCQVGRRWNPFSTSFSLSIRLLAGRITWTFGVNGKNFVKTMLNLSKNHDTIRVVNDQFGSPSYTYDLAKLLVDMVLTDRYGIYHATNEGIASWYDFACAIFREAGMTGSAWSSRNSCR